MARCEPSKSLPDKENVQKPQELEDSFSSTISNAGSHSASFSGLEMMMTTEKQFMVDHGGNTDKEVPEREDGQDKLSKIDVILLIKSYYITCMSSYETTID